MDGKIVLLKEIYICTKIYKLKKLHHIYIFKKKKTSHDIAMYI